MKSLREITEDYIVKYIDNGVLTEEDVAEIYQDPHLVPPFHIHAREVIEGRLYLIERDRLWEKNGYSQLCSLLLLIDRELNKFRNVSTDPDSVDYVDPLFIQEQLSIWKGFQVERIKEMKQYAGKRCLKHAAQEAHRRTTEKILIEAFNQKDLGLLMSTFVEECNDYKIIGKKKFKYC